MVFPVIGGDGKPTGYEISNSLRVEADDSPKLSKTVSTATNTTNMTFSFWYKLGELATMGFISKFADSNNRFHLRIMDDGSLLAYNNVSGTYHYKTTTAKLRDLSAWYHIVFAYDTTDSTAADRLKIYLNGTRLTSFVNNTNPSSNEALKIASDTSNPIKLLCSNDEDAYLSGYVSDLYYIDGQTKAPTDFGETNDNGVWIPKKYLGTFGNNGFKMEFQQTGTSANSSGIGADTSGNDNHLAVNSLSATDVTTDTPTNNFCTMNPLDVGSDLRDNGSFAEGNLEVTNGATSGQADQQRVRGTIAVTKGKWYFEMKKLANSAGIGVLAVEAAHGGTSANSMLVEYNDGGEIRFFNGSGRTTKTTGIDTYTTNDIVGCALDMDNNRAYFHKNGFYQGDPTPDPASSPSGAGQFGGIQTGFTMAPCMFDNSSGSAGKGSFNFGNAPFSISSGNSDANGYGNFEYAVPSGYYSLCTKNLAEYG